MVICPNPHCARPLPDEADVHKVAVADTGSLSSIVCAYCGHAGFLLHEGLHLVFRAGQEYCFTFGTTPAHLTISIPAEATTTYQWLGLTQEALARYATEWLLLLGCKAGVFTLAPDHPRFAGFMRYLEDRIPRSRPHVA